MYNTIKNTYPVLNMSCVACANRVTMALKKQDGIIDVNVNFATEMADIEYDPQKTDEQMLKSIVQNAGYDLIIEEKQQDNLEQLQTQKLKKLQFKTTWSIILAIPIFTIGMFFMHMPYADYIMWILSTPVVFWLGKDFYINAIKQLKNKTSNMDTLVAMSTGIAYLFSLFNLFYPSFWTSRGLHPHTYFESTAIIIAFILLGRFLEERAKSNTSSAIKKLMGMQPKKVTILKENAEQLDIPIEQLQINNLVIVKPGEKIPVDGVITEGSSFVDESMLNGEPIPSLKEKNSKVYSGTINQKGSFVLRAEKIGADTVLSQIIEMVKNAQQSKPPIQQKVDKITAVFVPTIIAISVITLIIWLIFAQTEAFSKGLLAMVTVLIIACPCALGLATPTAIMVGIGIGAENNILIKNSESLEIAPKIDTIVLDKTGTITKGEPQVSNISWLNEKAEYKHILYSIEKLSEHPLAEAVVNHLGSQSMTSIDNIESISGRGVKANVDKTTYFIGNKALMLENNLSLNVENIQLANNWQNQAKTVIWFANKEEIIALIAISDIIKDTSIDAIKLMKERNLEVIMLTGDNTETAKYISEQVGIDIFVAEVMPKDKANYVKKLQSQGRKVAMVGDGINDSAALAQADLSIAMGKGSDTAMDVAMITIISSDLSKIPQAISLATKTEQTIYQNLFWAFFYNLIAVPIAAGILYPFNGFLLNPMIAGAAMAFSSVSVLSSSLSLKIRKL